MSKDVWLKSVKKLASAKGYSRNTLLRNCSYEAGMLVATGELERFSAIEKIFDAAIKSKLAPNGWIMKIIRREIDSGANLFGEVYEELEERV